MPYVAALTGQQGVEASLLRQRIIGTGLAFENPETGILETTRAVFERQRV